VEFKRCTKPVHVPHGIGPARAMNIIYVDTPSGEAAEKSSSYNLSVFSSWANSEGAKVVAATHEDSSPSIRELWPDIDKLDDPSHEDTSYVHARNASIRGKRSATSIENTNKRSRHEGDKDSLTHIAETCNIRSKRCEGGSARREAARILSAAPGAISPHMWRSHVDRRYSPSISMGLSEWEVILDELIHMGYIVKKEPNSYHNE
jgi:hypothetical protein